jgi:peptide deformylase
MDVERLHIINYPDPRLRQAGKPIAAITPEVRAVARRMLELMKEADGVGLAAPQVGLAWRLFVCNPTGEPEGAEVYVNPRLMNLTGLIESEEGCLSIPNITGTIRRAGEATIVATDLDGRAVERTAQALAARVWQHEVDHLDGKLIIDRFTEADKLKARRTLRQLEKEFKERQGKAAVK